VKEVDKVRDEDETDDDQSDVDDNEDDESKGIQVWAQIW
jgi:hypothetical protein